jgi:hypothetical protein
MSTAIHLRTVSAWLEFGKTVEGQSQKRARIHRDITVLCKILPRNAGKKTESPKTLRCANDSFALVQLPGQQKA